MGKIEAGFLACFMDSMGWDQFVKYLRTELEKRGIQENPELMAGRVLVQLEEAARG